jgi:hypothetical protein
MVGIIVSLLSFFIPYFTVVAINSKVYGAALFENYAHGEFANTNNLWASVENGKAKNISVYISQGQREAVYKVSKTASLLKPYLETPPSVGWKTFYCKTGGDCNEFGAAWFPFALRDAAILAENISSEKQFQNFFRKINKEINAACSSQKIVCGHKGTGTGVPYVGDFKFAPLINQIVGSFIFLYSNQQNFIYNQKLELSDHKMNEVWIRNTGLNPMAQPRIALSTLRFYATLYSWSLILISIFALIRFVTRIKAIRTHYLFKINLPVALSLLLFLLGISILSNSWGFQAPLGFYLLPGFPIFLTFLVLNILLAFTSKMEKVISK